MVEEGLPTWGPAIQSSPSVVSMTGAREQSQATTRRCAGALRLEGTARGATRRRRDQPWASAHAGEGARGGAVTSSFPVARWPPLASSSLSGADEREGEGENELGFG
jgi:hypothetical protein